MTSHDITDTRSDDQNVRLIVSLLLKTWYVYFERKNNKCLCKNFNQCRESNDTCRAVDVGTHIGL